MSPLRSTLLALMTWITKKNAAFMQVTINITTIPILLVHKPFSSNKKPEWMSTRRKSKTKIHMHKRTELNQETHICTHRQFHIFYVYIRNYIQITTIYLSLQWNFQSKNTSKDKQKRNQQTQCQQNKQTVESFKWYFRWLLPYYILTDLMCMLAIGVFNSCISFYVFAIFLDK